MLMIHDDTNILSSLCKIKRNKLCHSSCKIMLESRTMIPNGPKHNIDGVSCDVSFSIPDTTGGGCPRFQDLFWSFCFAAEAVSSNFATQTCKSRSSKWFWRDREVQRDQKYATWAMPETARKIRAQKDDLVGRGSSLEAAGILGCPDAGHYGLMMCDFKVLLIKPQVNFTSSQWWV